MNFIDGVEYDIEDNYIYLYDDNFKYLSKMVEEIDNCTGCVKIYANSTKVPMELKEKKYFNIYFNPGSNQWEYRFEPGNITFTLKRTGEEVAEPDQDNLDDYTEEKCPDPTLYRWHDKEEVFVPGNKLIATMYVSKERSEVDTDITYNGYIVQASQADLENIYNIIKSMEVSSSGTISFRIKNNEIVQFTLDDLKNIIALAFKRDQALLEKLWALKDRLIKMDPDKLYSKAKKDGIL